MLNRRQSPCVMLVNPTKLTLCLKCKTTEAVPFEKRTPQEIDQDHSNRRGQDAENLPEYNKSKRVDVEWFQTW
jgi:hypothetical protein